MVSPAETTLISRKAITSTVCWKKTLPRSGQTKPFQQQSQGVKTASSSSSRLRTPGQELGGVNKELTDGEEVGEGDGDRSLVVI